MENFAISGREFVQPDAAASAATETSPAIYRREIVKT
jgi:hypothetical protein